MIQLMSKVLILMLLSLIITNCSSEAPQVSSENAAVQNNPLPAAQPQQTDDRPIILAFGDSLTAGYGVPHGSGYPELLQRKLDEEGYHYHVINAGISGDTTSGGIGRLDPELTKPPSIVILELGGNDGLRGLPVEQTRANLEEMILAFKAAGSQVILAGMTLPRNYGVDYVRAFEDVFIELAEKHKLVFIPFFLEGVAGQPGLVLPDGIHPSAEGYPIVTSVVWRYLEPLLKKS
jgi:acyl-CoA thioesterase I